MEWWQILVVGMGFLGTAAALTYGVLVAVVREKERIYQQHKRAAREQEEERAQLALTPVVIDETTALTPLPGLLASRGVRIVASGSRSGIMLRTRSETVSVATSSPTDQQVADAWFEEWYQKQGRHQKFKRPNMAGEIGPDRPNSHKEEARYHCSPCSQEKWDELTRKLTKTRIQKFYTISLSAAHQLLFEGKYGEKDLARAVDEVRVILLSLIDSLLDESRLGQDKTRMTVEAEEGGEVVKLKRG